MTYRHTPEMGEISGFGGDYEDCCQDMLEAGVNYIMAQKLSGGDLAMKEAPNIFGVCFPDNQPTEAMSQAVIDASKGEATGAMHHAVMQRLFYIAKYGWDKYCNTLKEKDDGNSEAAQGPEADAT